MMFRIAKTFTWPHVTLVKDHGTHDTNPRSAVEDLVASVVKKKF